MEGEKILSLAPLAGYTDMAFRRICSEFGMTSSATEMVSSRALYYGDKKTRALMEVHPDEAPVALQLFGDDPDIMAYVIESLSQEDLPFWAFDINMGCPAPKIVKSGAGAALLLDLDRAGDMLKKAVKASRLPVTLKCRKGFEKDQTQALEILKIAQDAGVSAITVHGRTREDYYQGRADRDFVKDLAQAATIPLIGNGDVQGPEDFKDYVPPCQGVAIGRGALGAPYIFEDLRRGLEGLGPKTRTRSEIFKIAKRHFLYGLEAKPESQVVVQMRKHFIAYLAGLEGAKRMREEVVRLKTAQEVLAWLDEEIQAQGS